MVLQATYCCDKLGLDREKVIVNGGAIAMGHPLGATGARCTATLLHEMQKRGKAARFGVVSMCIGSGMGAAAVFERGECMRRAVSLWLPCWAGRSCCQQALALTMRRSCSSQAF